MTPPMVDVARAEVAEVAEVAAVVRAASGAGVRGGEVAS